jgi:hypothetical protein
VEQKSKLCEVMINICMYIENKYYKIYFNIITKAQNRTLDATIKKEVHHILPRSLGGSDEQSNLVSLTLREHWICHRLLVKFLRDKIAIRKMYNALYIMAVKDYRTINSRIYQHIKENVEPWNKGLTGLYQPPLSDNSKEELRKLWKGKSRPKEHCDAMRAGWNRLKEEGYSPWNKGKTGVYKSGKPVIITSPDGKEYRYNRLKDGCNELGLIYSTMSSVNTGKRQDWKGWTSKPVNTI